MTTLVVHPFDDSFCSNLPGDPRPWADCQQPEHGILVTCSLCGKLGIEPDEGHTAEFLPAWMRRWACADCGEPQPGDRPPDGRCGPCLLALRRELGAEHQRLNHEMHGGGAP